MNIDEITGSASEQPGDQGLLAPGKAVRLLGMLQGLMEELDGLPLDERCRRDLVADHRAALIEMASTVSDALIDEMVRLHMAPLDTAVTAAEIRVAEAQLLGWVTGVLLTGGVVDGAPLHTKEEATCRTA